MIKKTVFIALFILIIISNVIYGYETNNFIIDIPQNYSKTDIENIYADKEGNTIGVMISEIGNMPYTEKNLDMLANGMTEKIDNRREEIKRKMYEQYGDVLAEEYIENYANNVKITIVKKEITSFGKNNYKCFHYIAFIDMVESKYYVEYYQTQSGKDTYMVTASSNDISFFEKEDIKNAIKSFEIKNYEEPKYETSVTNNVANTKYRRTENFLIVFCVIFSILGLIGYIKKYKNENKEKE